jgi:arsenate reductase
MKTVIFACVQNAGRSQMAAAFFNRLADPAKARAISAGTRPAQRVHGEVAQVMGEVGIELAGVVPQQLTARLSAGAWWLITMGCGEDCPVLLGVKRDDWPFPDPHGKSLEEVRAIRDLIKAKVASFIESQGWD